MVSVSKFVEPDKWRPDTRPAEQVARRDRHGSTAGGGDDQHDRQMKVAEKVMARHAKALRALAKV
jgi:hypothetical protein